MFKYLILLLYPFVYCFSGYLFKDRYYDKKAALGHECENDYYVPIEPWLKFWYYRILLWHFGSLGLMKYPDPKTGVTYANYRELQCTILSRIAVVPLLIADMVLFMCKLRYAGIFAFVSLVLHWIFEEVLGNPVMRHDVKRLKSYQYIVVNDDEAILSDARRNPPALWKLNTLLDVFFYFGEARIRYCESGNYLVYRLKNGSLMYIFLKESFETMPEPYFEPKELFELYKLHDMLNYNHAMAVWVDKVMIFDENMQNDDQLLTMKNIKPQDMPENIC